MTTTTYSAPVHTGTTTSMQDLLILAGRILLAVFFMPAGIGKVLAFSGTVGYITSKGLPMPEVSAIMAILIEVGVAAVFLLGYRTRLAAFVLGVFTLMTALLFHNFWAVPDAQKAVQTLMFNKNLAIFGGLLALAGFGGGRLSLDARR